MMINRLKYWFLIAFMIPLFCASVCSSAEEPREKLSLNGEWQMLITKDLSYPTGSSDWRAVDVPSLVTGKALGGSEFGWFRREISIPGSWRGQRIFLRLVGARYHPKVYLDGELFDERLEGWTPLEVELTNKIEAGKSSNLVVCVQDWGATFVEDYNLPSDATGDLRDVPKNKVIAPIGGRYSMYGLWDNVELLSRPERYLDDIAIVTSVRNSNLSIMGSGAGGLLVDGKVLDRGKAVLTLSASKIDSSGRWRLNAPFPDARYWSPEDPHLYILELTLREKPDGEALDVYQERFGFRELWAEGADFYLNGVKRHLLASSGWPEAGNQTDAEVRESLEKMRAGNNVAFRLHTQPWQEKWVRIADEVGMMIIEEGALWCDGSGGYAYSDQRFWDNVKDHLAGMVRRDRNHASLVMWSIENEILHCGASRYYPDAEKKLAEAGIFVRELDPSHLITYESDLDPGGVADVIGLHYPHEMPQYADYPNTADWLDKTVKTGTEGDLLGSRGKDFYWDRQKPLYIGEYLWIPYQDFSPGTVFFGDEAYTDRRGFNLKAKALAWIDQTLAYRRAGVSGTCPWTFAGSGGNFSTESILYQAQKEAYEPIAAFLRERDQRFYSGKTIVRTYDVFNDSVLPHKLELRWSLGEDGSSGKYALQLPPAGYEAVKIAVQLPDVNQRWKSSLKAVLLADGEIAHETSRAISVYPQQEIKIPAGIRLLVYDPDGKWSKEIPNLERVNLSSLSELSAYDQAENILVIAPYALRKNEASDKAIVGVRKPEQKELRRFLERGGGVLVLEQNSLDELSLGVSLVDHPSTMTFATGGDHPILRELAAEDFKFWRGDHYVSRQEIARPENGGARTLLVSGGDRSLAQGALVEISFGRGKLILCQALLGEKFSTEPVAKMLFSNAISYLAEQKPPSDTLVLSEDDDFVRRLSDLGVSYSRSGDFGEANLLILHAGGEPIESNSRAIQSFLAKPGKSKTVYWHAPDAEAFDKLSRYLGMDGFTIVPGNGPLTVVDMGNSFLTGICREDLTYVGRLVGAETWYRQYEPDPAIIDHYLSPISTSGSSDRLEIEKMDLEGVYVGVTDSGEGVMFASGGTATHLINVEKAGYYRFIVLAGGTPADGVYPRFEVSVNGKTSGSMTLKEGAIKPYALLVELPEGEVELKLAFVNDAQTANEDRNLLVDAILVDKEPIPESELQILTLPLALVAREAGDKRIVIDCVRWDTHDVTRGRRYASALLANLGASFAAPAEEPSWIPLSVVEPVGTIPYFRKDDQQISLAAGGTVEAQFQCITEGLYTVVINGRSTPAQGQFAIASVAVDGQELGEAEIKARIGRKFNIGEVKLSQGKHNVTVAFTNDLNRDGEDRNLYIRGIGFRLKE